MSEHPAFDFDARPTVDGFRHVAAYNRWLMRRAEALCLRCCPGLRSQALYVLDHGRLTPLLGPCRHAAGWTARGLCWVLKGVIGAAWRGPGPVLVIDTSHDPLYYFGGRMREYGRAVLCVAIHEATHASLAGPEPDLEPPPARLSADLEQIRRDLMTPPTPGVTRLFHGADFRREAARLCRRARRFGAPVSLRAVLGLPDDAPRRAHVAGSGVAA